MRVRFSSVLLIPSVRELSGAGKNGKWALSPHEQEIFASEQWARMKSSKPL